MAGPEDVQELPISPISLWQMGSVNSVHSFPSVLDAEKLTSALKDIGTLYPIIEGRFVRKRDEDGSLKYFIRCTGDTVKLEQARSDDARPFDSNAVVQPSLKTYVTNLNVATQLDNPDAPLLSAKLTTFASGESVLGLCWAHIMGDAHAFSTFTRILSDLYCGAPIATLPRPTFSPHISLISPEMSVLQELDIPQVYPSFSLKEGWSKYALAAQETEMVQVNLTSNECQLIKTLASEPGSDIWISQQDALSSYWINLLRLSGVLIEKVCNSVNYRAFFPDHPAFPPNLPSLVANVAQMWTEELPLPSDNLTLRPIALAIRQGLTRLSTNPEFSIQWLSCRAQRLQETCDRGETQCLVPGNGDCMVNSNARYDWNIPFGFDPQTTRYHTSFSTLNFLRVFRCNPDATGQIECTWNIKKGLEEKVLAELARDRSEGWSRWRTPGTD